MSGQQMKGYPTGALNTESREREYMLYFGGRAWGERLGKYTVNFDTRRCYPSQQLRDSYGLRAFYTIPRGLHRAVRRAMNKQT